MRGKRLGIWELPSPSQFLDEALATVWDGGAVLRLAPSVPEGLVTALTAPLVDEDFQPRALTAAPGGQPLKQLADVAGCPTDLRELVVCDRLVLIVDGGALAPGDLANFPVPFRPGTQEPRVQTH